eukprot:CAMPEP_0194764882 /NCGR_PEP_ID=MMETSP0323_2-20130528/23934_1 /TAXON_ID=2866 ORGANISM="Crypthecodinium cohnii, Strain Seligo" /NCGR_SAMPLE_ID=MMETSP0323_2 /ASSEMBLY_ACC=CAM_ASM_000346 /LENGTH=105 /DNA_ID=CAMNT_0039693053 /DNA_START=25 /DNA_END=342 /DNA_ORIENTATION=+
MALHRTVQNNWDSPIQAQPSDASTAFGVTSGNSAASTAGWGSVRQTVAQGSKVTGPKGALGQQDAALTFAELSEMLAQRPDAFPEEPKEEGWYSNFLHLCCGAQG